MEITQPLSDQSVVEAQPFTFTCQVSKPNAKARWLRDGQEVTPADGYEITVDGQMHTLAKEEAVLEDKGKFTAIFEGKSTAANLAVSGRVSPQVPVCACSLLWFESALLMFEMFIIFKTAFCQLAGSWHYHVC